MKRRRTRGAAISDYEDPLSERHPEWAGRRIAAFAPVGQTGYVFIVQANESDALGYEKRFVQRIAISGAAIAAPGGLLVLVAALFEQSRNARQARRRAQWARARSLNARVSVTELPARDLDDENEVANSTQPWPRAPELSLGKPRP